jgi:hypothetical protein
MYRQVNNSIVFIYLFKDLFFVGFEHNSDALAAAEIEQKMADFELEPIMNNTTNEVLDNDQ